MTMCIQSNRQKRLTYEFKLYIVGKIVTIINHITILKMWVCVKCQQYSIQNLTMLWLVNLKWQCAVLILVCHIVQL